MVMRTRRLYFIMLCRFLRHETVIQVVDFCSPAFLTLKIHPLNIYFFKLRLINGTFSNLTTYANGIIQYIHKNI